MIWARFEYNGIPKYDEVILFRGLNCLLRCKLDTGLRLDSVANEQQQQQQKKTNKDAKRRNSRHRIPLNEITELETEPDLTRSGVYIYFASFSFPNYPLREQMGRVRNLAS